MMTSSLLQWTRKPFQKGQLFEKRICSLGAILFSKSLAPFRRGKNINNTVASPESTPNDLNRTILRKVQLLYAPSFVLPFIMMASSGCSKYFKTNLFEIKFFFVRNRMHLIQDRENFNRAKSNLDDK